AANVPGGPVRTIPEACAHAPYAVMEHSHPRLGTVRTVRSPIGLDGEYNTAAAAPPLLGQHTDEVLAELGYDGDARSALLRGACRLA
ncbi:MAG: formyl-CoA transferase, partial [Gaiellales bacterium]|nr:formyl-CoA transferase [Gaiellales bacterium]